MRHLTVQQISASLDGALSGVSLELVVRHLSSCHECRERHARLTKQDDALRRLLACEFPDVHFDDMFARLGVLLEAESRGQMPPEHSLPPELPPLAPDRPPSREMPRPKSAAMRIPALPSEEEQTRRAAEELKAAEAAAISSLEELMREMKELKQGKAATPPEPGAASAPPAPAAASPPAQPPSLLTLPSDVLASLRQFGAERPEPEPEPAPEPIHAAKPPVPVAGDASPVPVTPEPEQEPEAVAAAPEETSQGVFEESTLTWVVVDGPLPTGPDIAGEREDAPVEEVPTAAEPGPIHVPAPEPVRVAPPEPIHVPAPEPVRAREPEPRRVAGQPPPAPRRVAPTPNPVDDPFADYEERLERKPPGHSRYIPPRGPRKRHVAVAVAGVAVLALALGSLGYLPPVIRVPVPELPRPRIPRIEVVKVPIAPSGQPAGRGSDARSAGSERSTANGETRSANRNDATSRVVASPQPASSGAAPAVPARAATKPPAPRTIPEPLPRAAVQDPTPEVSPPAEPARQPRVETPPVTVVPERHEPARTAPAPKPAASQPPEPEAEPEAEEGASWPLLCGVVVDDTGAPVAGARVALADLDLSARTDRRGRFCVAAPPGDRTLSVVAQGFATHRRIVSLGAAGLDLSVTLAAAP